MTTGSRVRLSHAAAMETVVLTHVVEGWAMARICSGPGHDGRRWAPAGGRRGRTEEELPTETEEMVRYI